MQQNESKIAKKKADTWNGDWSDFQEVVFVPHKSQKVHSLKQTASSAPLKSNGWKIFYIFLFSMGLNFEGFSLA